MSIRNHQSFYLHAAKLNPINVGNDLLLKLPSSPDEAPWWLITPSPMEFENISFSRPLRGESDLFSAKPVKYLACADCDLGPLGWCYEGSPEFWLAASRVAYRED